MDFKPVVPIKKALNKAYLRRPIERAELIRFKTALNRLFDDLDETESEEHCKNLFAEFLKEAFYRDRNAINTKGRVDLAIYAGTKSGDKPQVLFEVKRPANFQEMFSEAYPNAKALHELILYHLRERFEGKNLELKHLAITNVRELYLFDARDFEAAFAKDRTLVRAFEDSERGAGLALGTGDFYSEIAMPFVLGAQGSLEYIHLPLADLDRASRNSDFDLVELILPYKLLSPAHLLKEPFQNDSNSLDKAFYAELLHLMGLEEGKEGSKLVIRRPEPASRVPGSLIELASEKLELSGGLDRLPERERYGANEEDMAFAVVLELVLLWVNRLLFMKLLEAQILEHRGGDATYRFLTSDALPDFEALHELFFGVLAKRQGERHERLKSRFGRVPYLNSSLFETSELEEILPVDRLNARIPLRIHGKTVLKDDRGERLSGEMPVLEYILAFLEAYDFSAEGEGAAVERGKTLISASVLGLIFEKINGYKEGSFYTPGYVTQYMAKKTVESVVLRKFSESRGRDYADLGSLSNDLGTSSNEILEANAVFDTLRIVDPAVGSGHFLVSVLNELVAAKSELGILADHKGKRLKGVRALVENDELFLVDEEDASFATYRAPFANNERQRLRETLFEEKRRLIENCLFGVDLNRNSVQICKLRLWIELLKSSYYTEGSLYAELETLPNIDVNIKRGNSLVARYALDMDLAVPLKKKGWNVAHWMNAVRAYQNAGTKHEKREAEKVMAEMREALAGAAYDAMPDRLKLIPLKGELTHLEAPDLIARDAKDAKTEAKIEKLRSQVATIEERLLSDDANPIFREAFEWRYEFPEVLDENGAFTGFDAVIGNPPYIRQEELGEYKEYFKSRYEVYTGMADILTYFFERGMQILRNQGSLALIASSRFMRAGYGKPLREFIMKHRLDRIVDFGELPVFDEAATFPAIYFIKNDSPPRTIFYSILKSLVFQSLTTAIAENEIKLDYTSLSGENWSMASGVGAIAINKMKNSFPTLGAYTTNRIYYGIKTGLNEAFIIDEKTKHEIIDTDNASNGIIKRFSMGDNVRKWQKRNSQNYILLTKHGININNYQGVETYLLKFKNRLVPGIPGGRKPGSYKWYEIQDAVDYMDEFSKEKIVYPVICKESRFAWCDEESYYNDKTFFIPVADKALLGLLNSKAAWFYLKNICAVLGDAENGGRLELRSIHVSTLPIPLDRIAVKSEDGGLEIRHEEPRSARIESLVSSILEKKKADPTADVSALEAEIDSLVYSLYGLTEEEIAVVEGKG
jgi:adenine-specific DNA-methyltransferase